MNKNIISKTEGTPWKPKHIVGPETDYTVCEARDFFSHKHETDIPNIGFIKLL